MMEFFYDLFGIYGPEFIGPTTLPYSIFVALLKLSLPACVLIAAVLLARLLLRKVPKWISCALWALVALRLICPFTIESPLSVMPNDVGSGKAIDAWMESYVPGGYTVIYEGEPGYDEAVGSDRLPVQSKDGTNYVVTGVGVSSIPETVGNRILPNLFYVWVIGMAAMLLYAVVSYLRLKRRTAVSVLYAEGILMCDEIDSPFILGVFRPRIYLPSRMTEPQRARVLAHEKAHLKRHDHWWKPLGFLLLSVYWFNPLVWLAYILLCRDIEMACDERVVRDLGTAERADYAQALLDCSRSRRVIAACPLAFGEVGVKERVKSVLRFKKPAFWVIAAAVVACAVLALCFLTNQRRYADPMFETVEKQYFRLFNTAFSDPEGYEFHSLEVYSMKDENIPHRWRYFFHAKYRAFIEIDREWSEIEEVTFGDSSGLENFYCLTWDSIEGYERVNEEFNRAVKEWKKKTYTMEEIRTLLAQNKPEPISAEDGPASTRKLTLEDVKRLAQKGDTLTWKDFAVYQGKDIGSGLYVVQYIINDVFDVLIGGGSMATEPLYIHLRNRDNNTWVDIRTGDVDAFINLYQNAADPGALREKYPEYFDLDTFKGLEVYVWQMAPGSYSCGVMSGTNRNKTLEELMNLKGATIAEMRAILSTYDIDEKDVSIIPWQNPVSSYIAEYWISQKDEDPAVVEKRKQAYIDGIRQMLFGTAQSGSYDLPNPIIGASDLPNHIVEIKTAVAYANWTEDSRVFADCSNAGMMTISSVPHLPVYKLDTLKDLEQFKEKFRDILTLDHGYDEVPSFNDITALYDDSFFADHTLVLAYVDAPSGSFRYAIQDISYAGSAFCLDVVQTNDPETHTADMAGWFVIAEVLDSDIAGDILFDARLVGRE